MKNKKIVIVIVLSIFIVMFLVRGDKKNTINSVSDAYVFPITSDSPEWQNYDTLDKKSAITQLPNDVLETISTNGLIQTLLNHPLLPNVYAYSSDETAFLQMYKQLNAIEELCSRDDAGPFLLDYYAKIDDRIQKKMLSLVLSSSFIQNELTNEEKQIFKKLDAQFEFREGEFLT